MGEEGEDALPFTRHSPSPARSCHLRRFSASVAAAVCSATSADALPRSHCHKWRRRFNAAPG
jgi:hypothetical protein